MTIETTQEDVATEAQRDTAATQLVSRYAAWSAAAGVIPIPLADIAAVGALQLTMVRKLADLYDVPFSENLGKSLIASLLGSVLPASTAAPAALGIASMLKGVPLIGTTAAALTLPALSAGATYAVGHVFLQHFASGGTLLNFDPQDYREFMKAQTARRARATAPEPPPAASASEAAGTRTGGKASAAPG